MSIPFSLDAFIKQATDKYGGRYDYSRMQYVSSSNKVEIICPTHGSFWQTVGNHLKGGCRKCGVDARASSARFTTEQFVAKANSVHGDKYDYSRTQYTNGHTKVEVICREHGSFWQAPENHAQGAGCPACAVRDRSAALRHNKASFIDKANSVHGDKYDYSRVIYTNSKHRVEIVCPEHGVFLQAPYDHVTGHGCPMCGWRSVLVSAAAFAEEARKVHGDRYDYSRVKFVNSRQGVEIVCTTHGPFWQLPHVHISGGGCPTCSYAMRGLSCRNTLAGFLAKAAVVHGSKYDYSRVVYDTSQEKVEILCPVHGSFMQRPNDHIQGKGCPSCAIRYSSQEDFIAGFIESHGFNVQRRAKPEWMDGLELDIFVPEVNLAIEFNGTPFHASAGALYRDKPVKYHHDKWRLCRDNGIRLMQVYDFKWATRKVQHLHAILHALKLSEPVYARQCIVVPISTQEAKTFHDKHHHDGFKFTPPNTESFSLVKGNTIVGVITFSGDKAHRMSIRSGVSVVGGVSKLLSLRPQATMDVMLDFGGVNADGRLKSIPYWWVNPKTMESLDRRSCQKHKLEKRFCVPLSESDTETSYMVARGFMRVHGAGVMEITT